MTRILITGASGMLGVNLALEAAARYEVVGLVHAQPLHNPGFETLQADLLVPHAVDSLLEETNPDWVVNCAALTDLDACEQQPELAHRLNAELPGRLATETAKRGVGFLHVSSDAVFDGVRGNYREEDAPNPLSVYGRTKRLSELAVKAAHPQALIVRPNIFGWSVSGKHSIAEFFYNNLSAGKTVLGFTARLYCPILVTDLANIMLDMIERKIRGLFHTVSADSLSKYEFGVILAKRFGLDAGLIQPVASGNEVAPRAHNLILKTSNLAKALGRRPPTVAAGIDGLFAQFRSGYRDKLLAMAAAPEAVKG
ncbi:MAG TPA: SDR family oxidoreductase [Anaerolineales bacterium]|nr:SDR family oxidoreductase [Anaerolineales bacterium]